MLRYEDKSFDATVFGEPIRFLLSHQGIKFKENSDNQGLLKKTYPNLPLNEIEGKELFQSTAICRHLANKYHLAGTNENEKVAADVAVDTIIDLRGKINTLFTETADAEIRVAKIKEIRNGHGTIFLTYLNNQLKANGGFLVGGQLTWADLFFSAEYEAFLMYLGSDVFDKCPLLTELNKTVRYIPNIRNWLETRPPRLN